jgi:aspartate kinase
MYSSSHLIILTSKKECHKLKTTKVAKFGGTSMANAQTIKQVAKIIKDDIDIHFVVVSAPGKRNKEDIKVTDVLFSLAEEMFTHNSHRQFEIVRQRFSTIAEELGIKDIIEDVLDKTLDEMYEIKTLPFIVSRGEYLSAVVLSTYLKYEFVDATDLIRFRGMTLDHGKTNQQARSFLKNKKYCVIPGFYGTTPGGEVRTMPRGGSDITGALIARAVKAKMYENWTDVDGFLICDPNVVKNPSIIETMTYKELRLLSFMGATVLHSETFFPVSREGIPIHIRNTFNPSGSGTTIYYSISSERQKMMITGIAGMKDFTMFVLEKKMMSEIVGIDRKILAIPEKMGINVEHFPSGTDTFSMMIESKYLDDGKKSLLIEQLKKAIKPDYFEAIDHISLISIVGRNLLANNYNMLRLFTALVNDNITLKMIDYGSNGANIVIGVNDEDYVYAVNAIYDEFIREDEGEDQ